MNQTNPNRQLIPKRQVWVDRLQSAEWETGRRVLACFAARGLAAMEQVEKLTSLSHKQVRLATDSLTRPDHGLPALLRPQTVNLVGRPGRPARLDLLTVDGQAVLHELMPGTESMHPELKDRIELAHAYIEMEIYTAARMANLACELEKVFPLGDGQYIRADAVVESGKTVFFEIEQIARLADVPRIQDKLTRLVSFFRSPASQGISSDVRVVFNLPAGDGDRSLTVWRTVLGELESRLGQLPFRLLSCSVLDFLKQPAWENLDGFLPIEPLAGPMPESLPESTTPAAGLLAPIDVLPPFLKQQINRHPNVNTILKAMEAVYAPLVANWSSGRQDEVFFDTLRTIYESSHYKGGPVFERAEMPIMSLFLLFRHLHMAQNADLLKDVQRAWAATQRSLYHGVNLFRDAYTRMCWTFLRRHGFGPGGPLEIRVVVPGFQDERSDVHVDVRITNGYLIIGEDNLLAYGDIRRAQDALSWVLEALWAYGEDLGLKPKPKKKGV